ncbi:MAG: hypothetical protein ACR5LA_04480 [Wolbachia sp.]
MLMSQERKEYLRKKLKYSATQFGKVATRSDHQIVPKEEQLSINLGNRKSFDIISRILQWIRDKFGFNRHFFSEVGTEKRKDPATGAIVKYFTSKEQKEHALDIINQNGDSKFCDSKGRLYDTSNKRSKEEEGCVAYVVTLDGKLVVHEHIKAEKGVKESYCHSTLVGGKAILCSGLIKVVNGKITYVDNNSGHYTPTPANLYNVVKRFKNLFSNDAKVVCLSSLSRMMKNIPLIRKISAKQESVEKFLSRMEIRGKDGLTEYERYFSKVKKYNEQYRKKLSLNKRQWQGIFFRNYEPSLILKDEDSEVAIEYSINKNSKIAKMVIEHLIRKIIGANYGHKPSITIEYNEQKKILGASISFRHKDDFDRMKEILDLKKHDYISKEKEHVVVMSEDQANNFIKNTLRITQIDSIKQLKSSLNPQF